MLDCLSDLLVVLPQRRIEIDRERFEIRQYLDSATVPVAGYGCGEGTRST